MKLLRALILALAFSSPVFITSCATPTVVVAPQTFKQQLLIIFEATTATIYVATSLAERGVITKEQFGEFLEKAHEIGRILELASQTNSSDLLKVAQEMLLKLEKDLKAKQ